MAVPDSPRLAVEVVKAVRAPVAPSFVRLVLTRTASLAEVAARLPEGSSTIAVRITGGREQGYRAWSFKRGFPADPRGHWRVQVVTERGQLIGQLEFDIM